MSREIDIRIRAMEAGDVGAIQNLHNQPQIAAMTLQVPFQTRAEFEARIAPDPHVRRLVAEIGGKVIGDAGLHLYQRRRRHAGAIGMAVSEGYQGQGVGTALLAAVLDLADNWYALSRVELEVYVDNTRAIRLYEKHGFDMRVCTGTMRFGWGRWSTPTRWHGSWSYADRSVTRRTRHESESSCDITTVERDARPGCESARRARGPRRRCVRSAEAARLMLCVCEAPG